MSDPDDSQWRDEHELPLAELTEAMATYSFDGQVDDATGGDASAEQELGARRPGDREPGRPGDAGAGGDPDPDSEAGRRLRPSPDGRTGPV